MFPIVNPWAPGFRRFAGLGQAVTTSTSPAGAMMTAPPPPPPPAPSGPSVGKVGLALGSGVLVLGVSSVGVLFTYGIASETKSSLVRTTGYILAGAGALVAVIEAAALGIAVLKG